MSAPTPRTAFALARRTSDPAMKARSEALDTWLPQRIREHRLLRPDASRREGDERRGRVSALYEEDCFDSPFDPKRTHEPVDGHQAEHPVERLPGSHVAEISGGVPEDPEPGAERSRETPCPGEKCDCCDAGHARSEERYGEAQVGVRNAPRATANPKRDPAASELKTVSTPSVETRPGYVEPATARLASERRRSSPPRQGDNALTPAPAA